MFDLHCHTPFSDAQRDLDTIIQGLIDIGVKIVGFADHVNPVSIYRNPKRFGNKRRFVNNYSPGQLRYRREVFRIYDKKFNKIRILNGAEIDIYPHGGISLPRGIKPDFFDYLLLVKHHTLPQVFDLFKKRPKMDRWLWKHSPGRRLHEYLWEKGVYGAFRRYKPDIFGHFQDKIPRNISREKMKRFVLYAKKYDVAIELNDFTKSSKFKPIPRFLPVLEYGHECGAKFSLGSDFHGFQKDLRKQLYKSQNMYELAEKYDLELIDPTKFLPENRIKINKFQK